MSDAASRGGGDAISAQLAFDAQHAGIDEPIEAIDNAGHLDQGTDPANPERRIDPDQWDTAVAPAGRPQIVVGGPGTGKTEFLCRRVASTIAGGVPPERVLAVAFSRSGASDIRERLRDLVGQSAYRVAVGTYHSLASQLVERNAADLGWFGVPSILTGVEQERLVAELLSEEDPDAWSAVTRNLLGSDVMAAEITDFILRSSEQRLGPEDIAAHDRAQWRGIPSFLRRYDRALLDRNRVDYGRLLMQAATLVETVPSIGEEFSLVVADEYQDTSPVQSAFLLAIASAAGDLTVAADPYQSIYSFRGTDIDNVFSFPRDAEATMGTRAERLILTTSFRVPAEILGAAVSVTARELPGGAGRVRSTRTAGSVMCHEFSTTGTEAEWIASDIERIHLVEGVPLERIAVFVRSRTILIDELARALDRRHIDHGHADERLSEEPIIRFLNDLVIATGSHDEDDSAAALRRVLLGPVIGLPIGMVSGLPDDRSDRPAWVANIPGCRELADLLADDAWARNRDGVSGLWHAWSTLPQLAMVATDPGRERDRAAWSAQAQVMDRIAARSPGTTLFDHVEQTSRFDFEADPLYSINPGAGVTLATLHRAKGTEFDVVYIADAVEGQLPDLRQRDSLLGVRHLNPHLPTDTADYVTFRLDEERRLAYTAMTRSTTRVVWTATVASESGAGRSPSRFMRLVAPTTRPTFDDRPLTPRSLVASLRRRLVDPSAPDADRLAAARFLASAPAEDFDPLDSYGVRERGPDVGTVPDDLRLSPSQAVRYHACPRAFAIERYLLTRVEESVYMRFGTLVHAVVEATERTAITDGKPRGTTAAALRTLDELWDERGLGADTVGMAWKQRAATMLTDLYERWPSDGVPVSLETNLPLELGGVSWLGRADRIERDGEALTVVDYKTGSAASLADAAVSLQLGYYLLAARDSKDLANEGQVNAAVFWHPKQIAYGKVTTRSFDMANLDAVRDDLVAIADAIGNEQFDPTPGSHCRTCPASAICPAQAIGVEAFIA